ncbi:MAG: peptidylprolyl isomerase [Monoglobales bacterium]
MKKTMLSALSLLLAVVLFCSCSSQVKNSSVIASVNGEDILLEEYNYFLLFAEQSILASAGNTENKKDFWETTDIDGKNAAALAKERALDEAIRYTLISQKAKDMGISTETPEAKEQIAAALKNAEEFMAQYELSKDVMTKLLKKFYLESMIVQKEERDGKIDTSDENLKKVYEANFRTVKHILFPYKDPQTGEQLYTEEDALNSAKGVIGMINTGESDFDTLMNSLSKDPGLANYPNGYTFTNDGSMVPQFEAAAFALEVGEISEPVATIHGYHVLKREPLQSYDEFIAQNDKAIISTIVQQDYLTELINKLKAEATIERNDKVFEKVELY